MNWFFLAIAVLCFVPRSSAASWEEARAFADQGDWKSAASMYQNALANHPLEPSLHYNLGICLDHTNNPGRAVLSYERALQLSPRASDARHNLTLLREKLHLPEATPLPPGLPAFAGWLSREEWKWCSFSAALWMVAACWWAVLRSSYKKRSMPVCLAIIGFFLMTGSALIVRARAAEERIAVVTAADVSLLLSPFSSAETITACPPGSLLKIASTQGSFVYAEILPQLTKGWLPARAIERINERVSQP
jgi:tetratricopeptide (TPR) repeat protein